MIDQRRARRVPLDIYLNKFIKGIPFMARARDISQQGIYLTQLIEPDKKDERIGIQFLLPGTREVIYAEGQIVREEQRGRATGHGIRFTLITEQHRRLIASYVNWYQNRAA